MKKLVIILPSLFFLLVVNAQDEVQIGKGKTFGNYKNVGKSNIDQIAITGRVVAVNNGSTEGWCEEDCLTILMKKEDGNIITIGTRDNGFTVPKTIVGRLINVEGKDAGQIGDRRRRELEKKYQKEIQFAATGIMVID